MEFTIRYAAGGKSVGPQACAGACKSRIESASQEAVMYAIVPSALRVFLLALTAALALVASIPNAFAQSWPQRTVKLIIPLPPGTGTDIAGRLLAERLAGLWGQPVVVENKQGDDGIPAVTDV